MGKGRGAWLGLVASSLLAQTPAVPPTAPSGWETPVPPPGAGWRQEDHQESLTFGQPLLVCNRNGSLRIEGWDQERVHVHAEIRDSPARQMVLHVGRCGAELHVEAHSIVSRWHSLFHRSAPTPRCDLTLQVPRKVMGYFAAKNGSVFLRRTAGFARIEVTNGDIQVQDCAGEVWANTNNGNIEAHRLKARLRGNTTSGVIHLEEVEGGIQARSISGSIQARRLDGWGEGISLSTVSGPIELELGNATGELWASTLHGAMDLKLPGVPADPCPHGVVRIHLPGKPQKISLESQSGSMRIRP